MRTGPGVRIAVDIGGTFTDIVALLGNERTWSTKVSTTPDDPSVAVIEGIGNALASCGIVPSDVTEVVHGTTVGSNAILQKTGARTGLLTTRGFRDVLEIGRIRMPEMFDLTWAKPPPLVQRQHRLEVDERIGADGSIVLVLDEESVLTAAHMLCEAGIQSVAICLLNSYANPIHEQRVQTLVSDHFPSMKTTSSWMVLPEIKEYERTSTTVVNAYVLLAMQDYLGRVEEGMVSLGIHAPLLVVTSNGAILGSASARLKPVFAVASGPAGGVIGAARLGQASSEPDLIVFDMGGTTAKAAMIENGSPSLTSEYEFREGISTSSRFIKAGGYMLKVPAIDIAEVGAGGGSIASVDRGGLVQVGPRSAGSSPGPACYGLGNDRPTVTDANLVLGYLNPVGLAGGQLPIDAQLAAHAIERHVGEPLSLPLIEAAHGIRAVANANMARAIRAVTVERGKDPRHMTLIAFGGNGGLHAVDVARLLGVKRILVPKNSGVFSAIGMLTADVEHSFVRVVMREAAEVDAAELKPLMFSLAEDATAALKAEGFDRKGIALRWQADMRFVGQASELTVPFTEGPNALSEIDAAFRTQYRASYGYADEAPLEFVNLRCVGRGLHRARLDFERLKPDESGSASSPTCRNVSFERGQPLQPVPVISIDGVGGKLVAGPLVVDCYDTSVIVPPNVAIKRDAHGSLIINLPQA